MNDRNQIYVGNLDPAVTDVELAARFISDGFTVVDAYIIYDTVTHISRGFGFIELGPDVDQAAAIERMDRALLRGRDIRVNVARHRSSPIPGRPSPSLSDQSESRNGSDKFSG